MKKLFAMLAVILVMIGCQKEEIEKPDLGARALSNRITPYEAIDFAINALYDDVTRGYNAPRATVSVYGTEQTRSGESVDSMFYFVNFENNGGYAIVSTDRRAGDVIAFSRSGNVDPDSIEDGSAMDMVMTLAGDHYLDEVDPDDVRDSIVPIVPNDYLDYPKVVSVGDWTTYNEQSPLVEMEWHQGPPFNYRSPFIEGEQAPAGCLTIALAHIMSYYQYPESHNGIDFRWGLLLQTNPFVTMTEDYMNHMAEFIADIGQTIEIDYGKRYSKANMSQAKAAAEDMGYYASPISTALVPKQPIHIYCVGAKEQGSQNVDENGEPIGHAFVVDGYITERRATTYIDYDITLSNYYYYDTYESRCHLHCNWGMGLDPAPEYCIYEVIQPSGYNEYYDFSNFYMYN